MDPITQQQALASAGAAGGDPVYVDDVFSTYVYPGNNTTGRDIVNGIDLSGEGGLVWVKKRSASENHVLIDTERGANNFLMSDVNNAANTSGGPVTAFNSNGFEIDNNGYVNSNSSDYASWTFRKAPGFFDVVTYTGNGTAGRTVSHSLGSTPGMVIVKSTSNSENWAVWHRSISNTQMLQLHSSDDVYNQSEGPINIWNSTTPTSTAFTVGDWAGVNANGYTYVAYVFAHDDQSFGTASDESVIKCGSYTGNGTSQEIDLGFEAQWVLVKTTDPGSWYLYDVMRGMAVDSGDDLRPNSDTSESTSTTNYVGPSPNGFTVNGSGGAVNYNGDDYIYIAIRRSHKPPEAGTDVFAAQATRGASDGTPDGGLYFTSGFPVDLMLQLAKSSGSSNAMAVDRLRWDAFLRTSTSAAEVSNTGYKRDHMEGIYADSNDSANSNFAGLLFKRAAGFFDMVAYEGTGSARTINHNLDAVPKMIIAKKRDSTESWSVYHEAYGNNKNIWLNDNSGGTTNARWNNTTPTDSVFSVGTDTGTNGSGGKYIAYLFGDVSGISKVGSYTGTGNDIDVDCGFTAGARFVLIKRYGADGEWYVWDSARGIVAGNDPYVELNSQAGEVTNTDYLDPLNAGFTVTSTANADLNTSGGTYLFLAIA